HKSKSWSSSADGTVADRALPPRIPTRLRSDPVVPPRRRRNTPSDLPATSRADSRVTANLAQAGRRGKFFPYLKLGISTCEFQSKSAVHVEYSDTLLEQTPPTFSFCSWFGRVTN